MESKSRRVVSCDEEDRISNLPEDLINSILEPLSVQDVVRTSILSKNWRYKWTKMKVLVFYRPFFRKYAKNGAFGRNGFIRIINKVMILHTGPISKFVLHMPTVNMDLNIFEEVDQWMQVLSRNGVRELILINWIQCYGLHSHVFSCRELTKLILEKCFWKPPVEFEGFLNLEDLDLRSIDFGANLSGSQISLPQLKKLSLSFCTNVYNFNIKTKKLQTLDVTDCLTKSRNYLL